MADSEPYFVSVAVPRPLHRAFTYRVPPEYQNQIQIGQCVKVPFGRTSCKGVIVSEPFQTLQEGSVEIEKVKPILSVGDSLSVIPEEVLRLCRWAEEYYFAPLGEILQAAGAPAHFEIKRKKGKSERNENELNSSLVLHPLSEEQRQVFDSLLEIQNGKPSVSLLEGVTGSGKTEIYFHLARQLLNTGRGVIFMVPEIALTPQLFQRFQSALGKDVCLWHSALSDGVRRKHWEDLREGRVRAVVGARSAVFAPVQNLSLIVVDEEHDSTYKQDERFRYQARDLAIVRGQQQGAQVILGSATPSWETLERVREGKYKKFHLRSRFGSAQKPQIEIVSLREKDQWVPDIRTPIHKKVKIAIQETIDRGEQVMVFLNRRGFANFLLCKDCGHIEGCPNCSISLTIHKRKNVLKCHQCGLKKEIIDLCSKCQSYQLEALGSGTESLETDLEKMIQGYRGVRLDRDQVTSEKRLTELLQKFRSGKANCLLGTQMIVKGHDFPKVTLVLVVLADMLFRLPDFRSSERAFQVLTQVSGRAGRAERPGRVMIQTYAPEHPMLHLLSGSEEQWRVWYEEERSLREMLGYPPFSRMARIRVESADSAVAKSHSECVSNAIQSFSSQGDILGPSEAFIERVKGKSRWDLILKFKRFEELHRAVRQAFLVAQEKGFSILVDMDPNGLG